MKNWHLYAGLIVVIIIILVMARGGERAERPAKTTIYDDFAQCLTGAGATFYGAYWCPHCQEQKAMFEDSDKIPYVECSTPGGQSQTQVCTEAGITGYPTWRFTDGEEFNGTVALDRLAEKTGCELPQ